MAPAATSTIEDKWRSLAFTGAPDIVPGWDAIIGASAAAAPPFSHKAERRPPVVVVIVLDGEPSDLATFVQIIESLPPRTLVVIGVIGFGGDHDDALGAFRQLAKMHPGVVKALSLTEHLQHYDDCADALHDAIMGNILEGRWA